jgi:hypothetical protein
LASKEDTYLLHTQKTSFFDLNKDRTAIRPSMKKRVSLAASVMSQSQRSCYEMDSVYTQSKNRFQEDADDIFKINCHDMQLDDKISLQLVALSADL